MGFQLIQYIYWFWMLEVQYSSYRITWLFFDFTSRVQSSQARFTLGVRAYVQPKSSIPIGEKVEISPNGFTLGVKAELEKIFSICPKLLINAELYGLVLAPSLEKGYHQIWEANLQPLGPNNKPKMLKVGPKFSRP